MSASEDIRPNASPAPMSNEATIGSHSESTSRPTTDFLPSQPSETVAPTQVTTPPQQAATQPDSGGVQTVVIQPSKPSFNQRVVGYAKEIRGTVLHNQETKDLGGRIRKGEEIWPPQGQDGATTSSPTQTVTD